VAQVESRELARDPHPAITTFTIAVHGGATPWNTSDPSTGPIQLNSGKSSSCPNQSMTMSEVGHHGDGERQPPPEPAAARSPRCPMASSGRERYANGLLFSLSYRPVRSMATRLSRTCHAAALGALGRRRGVAPSHTFDDAPSPFAIVVPAEDSPPWPRVATSG